ncbi:uncharacterized protein LOC111698602 isoform X2 [Eurytemora carolleeae]|uniref:uncharacterized protein LOC111698602 isoform X2 n=1 Tax=Eurytemora carolleeae TaxID=1294199 RepID=UPI000C760B39|nr:uncharacterized protein LOC111698602 isoform X2 [Eurytemora carolleeae]|eukprot:XP_023324737.1 uncharacterized protein LOC111698602 isoform X2 [Eurytemora affinis]
MGDFVTNPSEGGMQHRRISLPEGGKAIQSCSSKTAGKNHGHYSKENKGLPPNALHLQSEASEKRLNSVDDEAAQITLLSLKSDRATLHQRTEFQIRQREICVSNIVEEVRHVRDSILSIHDPHSTILIQQLDRLQDGLEGLVKSSQFVGRLKYEEKCSKQMDTIRIYAASLSREREEMNQEMKMLGANSEIQEIKSRFNNEENLKSSGDSKINPPETPDFCINWKVEGALFQTMSLEPGSSHLKKIQDKRSNILSFDHSISQDGELEDTGFRINCKPPGEKLLLRRREKSMEGKKRVSDSLIVACSPGSRSGLVGTWVASQVERRFTELLNQIKLRISNSWILDSIVGIELEKTQALNFASFRDREPIHIRDRRYHLHYRFTGPIHIRDRRYHLHYRFTGPIHI